jgi:hypothetical protein
MPQEIRCFLIAYMSIFYTNIYTLYFGILYYIIGIIILYIRVLDREEEDVNVNNSYYTQFNSIINNIYIHTYIAKLYTTIYKPIQITTTIIIIIIINNSYYTQFNSIINNIYIYIHT